MSRPKRLQPREIPIRVLPGLFAVCQLPPGAGLPAWAEGKGIGDELVNVSRTRDELSIVCAEQQVPPDTKCQRGWRVLKLEGPFDFGEVGILKNVLEPMAEAGIGIFAVSTYNTDYILVPTASLDAATAALEKRGFPIARAES